MNQGQTVFAQLIRHLSHNEFRRCVDRYRGNHRIRNFSCWDQFLALAFAQLTFRESLRDIEDSLGALQSKLYHMGFHSAVKRSTLADANETRDWRIFADFAHSLIHIARPLYRDSPLDIDFGADVEASLYALGATVIDLCLNLTNNFVLSALSVAAIYRHRWTIESFFKLIKQNLRIKGFFGTSPNSVKTQIWIAITVYALIAVIKKRLGLQHSFSQILQILSLTLFEKVSILSLFQGDPSQLELGLSGKQLTLLNI